MKFSRTWAMPSADTFSIKPIGDFVRRYLSKADLSIDPFARNNGWTTFNNDINPNTSAKTHKDAVTFLKELGEGVEIAGFQVDLIILDPPYTPRQIAECYRELGMKVTQQDTQSARFMKEVRDAADPLVRVGGVVLSFGYNSTGMGKKRGYEIEEIMLCASGGAHNDIICMAERKLGKPSVV